MKKFKHLKQLGLMGLLTVSQINQTNSAINEACTTSSSNTSCHQQNNMPITKLTEGVYATKIVDKFGANKNITLYAVAENSTLRGGEWQNFVKNTEDSMLSTDGSSYFIKTLKENHGEAQKFICYITTEKPQIQILDRAICADKVLMVVTCTLLNSIAFHMGISTTQTVSGVSGISHYLHTFAANLAKFIKPTIKYSMTQPTPIMESILTEISYKLKKQNPEKYDLAFFPASWEDKLELDLNKNLTPQNYLFPTEEFLKQRIIAEITNKIQYPHSFCPYNFIHTTQDAENFLNNKDFKIEHVKNLTRKYILNLKIYKTDRTYIFRKAINLILGKKAEYFNLESYVKIILDIYKQKNNETTLSCYNTQIELLKNTAEGPLVKSDFLLKQYLLGLIKSKCCFPDQTLFSKTNNIYILSLIHCILEDAYGVPKTTLDQLTQRVTDLTKSMSLKDIKQCLNYLNKDAQTENEYMIASTKLTEILQFIEINKPNIAWDFRALELTSQELQNIKIFLQFFKYKYNGINNWQCRNFENGTLARTFNNFTPVVYFGRTLDNSKAVRFVGLDGKTLNPYVIEKEITTTNPNLDTDLDSYIFQGTFNSDSNRYVIFDTNKLATFTEFTNEDFHTY